MCDAPPARAVGNTEAIHMSEKPPTVPLVVKAWPPVVQRDAMALLTRASIDYDTLPSKVALAYRGQERR